MLPLRDSKQSMRAFLCVLFLCLSQLCVSADPSRYVELTILHSNDVHGHLFPFDYDILGSDEKQVGGVARRTTLIRQIKNEVDHPVLVMDAGDVFQRGPLADLLGEPDFAAMNAVPYDIMTLGNNEFKGALGMEAQKILFDRIKQAQFPVISANVFDGATGKTIVPPYHIFEIGGARVGVFGLTAPRTGSYSQTKGLEVRDFIAASKQMVSDLKGKADFIIGLTHIGFAADLELAACVPEIDVIIGADSHTFLFQPLLVKHSGNGQWSAGGTLVCQTGEWGRFLGRLDLRLRLAQSDQYEVESYSGKLISVDSSIKPATDVDKIVKDYAKPYLRKVGYLGVGVAKQETAAWVAERMREAVGAQVGIEPIENVENGLEKGDVTYLDVRSMFPFVNPILKLTVSGDQIRQFTLQRKSALAGIRQVNNELYVSDGKLDDKATYTLAVESFYAQDSPALRAAQARQETGMTTLDAVVKYLEAHTQPK